MSGKKENPAEETLAQSLAAEAQKAFEASKLGKELEGSPNRFVFGEIWKQGWIHGWKDGVMS